MCYPVDEVGQWISLGLRTGSPVISQKCGVTPHRSLYKTNTAQKERNPEKKRVQLFAKMEPGSYTLEVLSEPHCQDMLTTFTVFPKTFVPRPCTVFYVRI
jgi:hypothetical protein